MAWHIQTRQLRADRGVSSEGSDGQELVLINFDPELNEPNRASLEAASSVLLQLASAGPAGLKERVLSDALLPSLVTFVLQPFAAQAILEASRVQTTRDPPTFNQPLFCNVVSIVRSASRWLAPRTTFATFSRLFSSFCDFVTLVLSPHNIRTNASPCYL